jgi:hypothetical protein
MPVSARHCRGFAFARCHYLSQSRAGDLVKQRYSGAATGYRKRCRAAPRGIETGTAGCLNLLGSCPSRSARHDGARPYSASVNRREPTHE